jgi:hypothetical protein
LVSGAGSCPYAAGTFTSPTGTVTIPADYASSVSCEYVVTTGVPIVLRFDSFDTEAGYDFVEVYDGTSATGVLQGWFDTFATGTLLGKFSGSATPTIQTATSGSMFIRFTSDGSTAQGGVSMTWFGAMPHTLACHGGETVALAAEPVTISLPGYTGNMQCTWVITGVPPIELEFLSFATESCCDFVTVYRGNGTDVFLRKFSGWDLPARLKVGVSTMTVTFTSDGSGNLDGFVAVLKAAGGSPDASSVPPTG